MIRGEIYELILYSYSFLIRDVPTATDYYLFGLSVPSVQPMYKHPFFVRAWDLENVTNPFISAE